MNVAGASLKDHIYSSILQKVIQGEYSAEEILNEKALMTEFNVSRAPIREALVALCDERILYSIPYRGYKLTPITDEDLANVKAFRCTLECGFMHDNWDKLTETKDALDHIEAMRSENISLGEENDAITHWNENIRFHMAFFEIYDNEYASQSLSSAMSIQTRAYAQTRWDRFHSTLFHDKPQYHDIILDTVKNGDMKKAVRLLRDDIMSI